MVSARSAKVVPEMGLHKVERARRRALLAGPFPKPRGRAPRGSNGLPKVWDKEFGGWTDAVPLPQPAWAWSSTLELLELGAASEVLDGQ